MKTAPVSVPGEGQYGVSVGVSLAASPSAPGAAEGHRRNASRGRSPPKATSVRAERTRKMTRRIFIFSISVTHILLRLPTLHDRQQLDRQPGISQPGRFSSSVNEIVRKHFLR